MNNNKLIGKAGEYLACFDANINGYSCSLTTEESAYDIVLDTGKKLLKIQVKSSTYSRSKTFESLSFTVCRRNSTISEYNVDMFAFVDIENRAVAWMDIDKVNKYRVSIKRNEFSLFDINSALRKLPLPKNMKNMIIRDNTYYADLSITENGKHRRIRSSLGKDYESACIELIDIKKENGIWVA